MSAFISVHVASNDLYEDSVLKIVSTKQYTLSVYVYLLYNYHPAIFLKQMTNGHRHPNHSTDTVSKTTLTEDTSERQGGAHMGFP